jgi:hypothetical protein
MANENDLEGLEGLGPTTKARVKKAKEALQMVASTNLKPNFEELEAKHNLEDLKPKMVNCIISIEDP